MRLFRPRSLLFGIAGYALLLVFVIAGGIAAAGALLATVPQPNFMVRENLLPQPMPVASPEFAADVRVKPYQAPRAATDVTWRSSITRSYVPRAAAPAAKTDVKEASSKEAAANEKPARKRAKKKRSIDNPAAMDAFASGRW